MATRRQPRTSLGPRLEMVKAPCTQPPENGARAGLSRRLTQLTRRRPGVRVSLSGERVHHADVLPPPATPAPYPAPLRAIARDLAAECFRSSAGWLRPDSADRLRPDAGLRLRTERTGPRSARVEAQRIQEVSPSPKGQAPPRLLAQHVNPKFHHCGTWVPLGCQPRKAPARALLCTPPGAACSSATPQHIAC
jgi:hypothetical protein